MPKQRKNKVRRGPYRDIIEMSWMPYRIYGCSCDECQPPKLADIYPADLDRHRKGKCPDCKNRYSCYVRESMQAARRSVGRVLVVTHRSGESVWAEEAQANTVRKRVALIKRLRQRVKDARMAHKEAIAAEQKMFGTVMVGDVRQPVRDLLAQKSGAWKIALCQHDYGPVGPDRHVGVEIECGINYDNERYDSYDFGPRKDLQHLLSKAGLSMRTTIVSDGSVEVEDKYNIELRVCDKESRIYQTIDKVCEILKQCGAEVNETCGLHVHLDMRSRNWEKCYKRLHKALRWMYAIVHTSRKEGGEGYSYCQEPPEEPNMHDRYMAINATSVSAHKTLEVRLHQGTVNPTKIKNWIRFLLLVVDGPDVQKVPKSLDAFARRYKVPEDLKVYIGKRAKKFGARDVRIPQEI